MVIHNISQMSLKNDMSKLGIMDRINTNSLNLDLKLQSLKRPKNALFD
jgi:hypothetical protein